METHKEKKRKVKMCICQNKKEVNEQFGRKMNQDMNENRKLFWNEVSKASGGKVENCMGGWHWNMMRCEGFESIILRIFII